MRPACSWRLSRPIISIAERKGILREENRDILCRNVSEVVSGKATRVGDYDAPRAWHLERGVRLCGGQPSGVSVLTAGLDRGDHPRRCLRRHQQSSASRTARHKVCKVMCRHHLASHHTAETTSHEPFPRPDSDHRLQILTPRVAGQLPRRQGRRSDRPEIRDPARTPQASRTRPPLIPASTSPLPSHGRSDQFGDRTCPTTVEW